MSSIKRKTVIITGGIVSGIGKGITSASIGRLLIEQGYTVAPVKADPYLNQDAGTMNPFQHGEVFVTADGAETDLDLGHYERFLDLNLSKHSNFTSGSVYCSVMDLERDGEFLGKTIQIIPHVTDEIKNRISKAGDTNNADFLLWEIGGTIGDIEALPFIEAARQYASQNKEKTIFVHVVKMDYLFPSDEGKTKPIQHAVTTLRSYGIHPDILIIRCKRPLLLEEKQKIALFTGVPADNIIVALDAKTLYDIPRNMEKSGITEAVLHAFNLRKRKSSNTWGGLYENINKAQKKVIVGLVGKYVDNSDAYLSVFESIKHAAILHQHQALIVPINSEDPDIESQVKECDAIVVPGGFGSRGIEGKIKAIQICRESKIPYLGLCLGLQTAVIEIANHLAKLKGATSTEFDKETSIPVIDILPDQLNIKKKGGTMRLGNYPALLKPDSLTFELYNTYRPEEIKDNIILERHRHRYEVNPAYHKQLEKAGLVISGTSPDGSLVEFIELKKKDHPFFVATQSHPEFRSRPNRPHPLFAGLIAAAVKK